MTSPLNTAFMLIQRRAETYEPEQLVATFVDVGPLLTLLNSVDHQVLYGRRGTGKTHALHALASRVSAADGLPIYIDLRTIGSTGGLYGDESIPIAERGTRLLMDVLGSAHEKLVDLVLRAAYDDQNIGNSLQLLDELAEAVSQVEIVGERELVTASETTSARASTRGFGAGVESGHPAMTIGRENATSDAVTQREHVRDTGVVRHRVHFGRLHQILSALIDELPFTSIWLLLDEWSALPLDLQPLLADLIRRSMLPLRGFIVKIGAIEQRSSFRDVADDGSYVGIEVGADVAADLDLDDFMVFGNDRDRAQAFFRDLIYRRVIPLLENSPDDCPAGPEDLVRMGFTRGRSFEELVRAAEGVPRDAINILSIAAQRADSAPISVNNVRGAARSWFLRDKERAVASDQARALLHWIIDEVIGGRRARAFLLEQGSENDHALFRSLYDSRVLHVVKRSVSSRDTPGVRYDVYQLDFGCYVELINTANAPGGLFEYESDDGTAVYADVPEDDYRSIRRAILSLSDFVPA